MRRPELSAAAEAIAADHDKPNDLRKHSLLSFKSNCPPQRARRRALNSYPAHREVAKEKADMNFLDIEWSYLILYFGYSFC